ncbi:hypothetical protein DFH06DRAFT_1225028 [Mycena polygramma]|nr:hypothetical protein DFH06DRAFT_1225028 [Mycena polygramma]
MSSLGPEVRFRIPGGSLDLDSDDDHADGGTTQSNVLPAHGPPPPLRSVNIAHLTPVDLSCVLSQISHPVAASTAEYVRALNLSGIAFRNLDLSALNILANHDPALAEQLLRLQAGFIIPSTAPTQAHISSPSWAEPQEQQADSGEPLCPPPGPSSDPPPPTHSAAQPVAPTSEQDTDPPASDNDTAVPTADCGELGSNFTPPPAVSRTDRSQDGVGDDDKRTSEGNSQNTTAAPPRGEQATDCLSPSSSEPLAVLNDSPKEALPNISTPPMLGGSARDACATPRDVGTLSQDVPTETDGGSSDAAGAPEAEKAQDHVTDNLLGTDVGALSEDIPSIECQTNAGGGAVAVEVFQAAMDLDGDASQAGASADVPVAAKEQTDVVDKPACASLVVDGGSSKPRASLLNDSNAILNPGAAEPDLGDSPLPNASLQVSTDQSMISDNSADVSFSPSPRDLYTATSGSGTSINTLETPTAATEFDHVDDPSFLEFDLLHFSPFSFGAQVIHDDSDPSTELFKGGAFSFGADASDLMDGVSCEEKSESEIDIANDDSYKSAPSPNLVSLAHVHSSTPPSSTTETHDATVSRGDEGISLPLPQNRRPAFYMDEAPKNVHGQANQHGVDADSNLRPPLEEAVDSLPCPVQDVEGRRACDDQSLARDSNSASPGREETPPAPLADPDAGSSAVADVRAVGGSTGEHSRSMETHGARASGLLKGCDLRPPLLGLTIPVSPTSLEEELSQLSPLFSPVSSDKRRPASKSTECSTFGRLFSERSFSVPRTVVNPTPVKLRRGHRTHRVARHSRGTGTSDLDPSPAVLVDVSVQTEEDVEAEHLRRRVKMLERELRSLRALRRTEDRPRESKPKSFWKKVATTDRIVPPPEPLSFGLLKDVSWNFSSSGQTSSAVTTT